MEVAANTGSALPKVDLVNARLAAALSHPTRLGVMSVLSGGPASPRQIAAELDEPLSNVTYHVKQLRDLGCIELDRTEQRAGGRVLERFYRASRRAYFDDDAWQVLNEGERLGVLWAIIRLISQDIATAMAAGTFFDDCDTHLSRAPMTVDEEGWREMTDLLSRTTEGLFEIEGRVAERRADGAAAEIHAKVELMQFRSPAPNPADR
ncbi:MAG TPA: helix-turn-helix domain-containing protein [Solirubrobacterales bacterium]|nr:helix-turn-helix domain-containing protein [Solirubrobacterales bacterium]